MPPRRALPSKANKSTKLPPIKFDSVESIKASRPEFTSETWLEEGLSQEENGERYQFGDKSQRHYSNALICYAAAKDLSTDNQDDSIYNSARILYILATEFDSARHNIERIMSIQFHVESGIDSEFNLAQSLSYFGTLLDEGAHLVTKNGSSDVSVSSEIVLMDKETRWKQAGVLFEKIELDQTQRMQENMMEMEQEQDDGNLEITTTITPFILIETILALLSNNLNLIDTLSSPPQSAFISASQRIKALQQLNIPDSKQELEVDLISLSIESAFAPLSPDIVVRYQQLMEKHGPDVELLSNFADCLLEQGSIDEAQNMYESAFKLLSDPFKKQVSIPNHVKPSIISSNLLSRAGIALLQFVQRRDGEKLKEAVNLAKLAITATKWDTGRKDWRTIKAVRDATLLLLRAAILSRDEGACQTMVTSLESLVGNSKEFILRFIQEITDDNIWQIGNGNEELLWNQL